LFAKLLTSDVKTRTCKVVMTKRKYREQRIFRIVAACLLLGLTAQTNLDEPFGLPTVSSPKGPLSANWNDLQAQINLEQAVVAQCRDEANLCSSRAAARFVAILNQGEQRDGIARIGHINRAINLAILGLNNQRTENWTPPLTALSQGSGDCKQYSVLKYVALTNVGFAQEDLRIVIVMDKTVHRQHAVVAVRHEGRWLILDNRSSILVESSDVAAHYIPLNVLDQQGVREFVGAPTLAQQAARFIGK
jgi:predicted transglutaminase-like cysteine proteinase